MQPLSWHSRLPRFDHTSRCSSWFGGWRLLRLLFGRANVKHVPVWQVCQPADTDARRQRFCHVSVFGRSTHSSVHCWRLTVSCCSRGTVFHCTSLLSSQFLIQLSDSSLIFTVPMQWLVILDTLSAFNIYLALHHRNTKPPALVWSGACFVFRLGRLLSVFHKQPLEY